MPLFFACNVIYPTTIMDLTKSYALEQLTITDVSVRRLIEAASARNAAQVEQRSKKIRELVRD